MRTLESPIEINIRVTAELPIKKFIFKNKEAKDLHNQVGKIKMILEAIKTSKIR